MALEVYDAVSLAQSTRSSEGHSPPPASEHTTDGDYRPEQEEDMEMEAQLEHIEQMDEAERYGHLNYVLEKSTAYVRLIKERMDLVKARPRNENSEEVAPEAGGKRRRGQPAAGDSKRRKTDKKPEVVTEEPSNGLDDQERFVQPKLITGAKMKDYQLEGVAWLVALYENGISGILADEMGLGKTLQTIAFHAYLRERKINSPFLIVCPLSVMHNWAEEFQKFAPSIPVCTYHGTPGERAEIRRTELRTGPFRPPPRPKGKKKAKGRKSAASSEEAVNGSWEELQELPVVITTYEMVIKDRVHLSRYKWGYIVVDEGHRLKNFDSKLMRELKQYDSACRMVLTGTPLHNNLAELWSLLNFVLPDIFQDLNAWQQWFNLSSLQGDISSEESTRIINALHSLLSPFLLRRLKTDVEQGLPPKKEYVLYAPLAEPQRKFHTAILNGALRKFLLEEKQDSSGDAAKATKAMLQEGRKLRSSKPDETTDRKSKKDKGSKKPTNGKYDVDGDDDKWFERLENGEFDDPWMTKPNKPDTAQTYWTKAAAREVNNMRLQNVVMQLRKASSHPFLFEWPLDRKTQQPVADERIVAASGKMQILDQLLDELFRRKHKVLVFSQFTTMLDLIEDWARHCKGWNLCRIDGSTPHLERREQMNLFQEGGDDPDAPQLFLLSTRAGGLGINLTAADTVIFYDQDWNPQMDLQAQDRAHRIGQTKPVLIFRLVTANTIETNIMQRANEKRKLEALVIAKGRFKTVGARTGTFAELVASLLKLEGEKVEVTADDGTAGTKAASVLSEKDLNLLLDRSPEVFADRSKGWTSANKEKGVDAAEATGERAAFEVFEGTADQGNDALAHMLGEDVE